MRFKLPEEVSQFQIDQMNFGVFSMIRTFRFDKNGESLPSSVFYLNNTTEELIAEETW